jgi:hypothetical protein
MRSFVGIGIAASVVLVSIVGCSIGETRYETMTLPIREIKEAVACKSPFVTPNLAELPVCGDGKGHCFPGERTPLGPDALPPCPGGGHCVPDNYLKAGGTKAKSCTFFMGQKPGACMSTIVKDIGANQNQLKQDVCEPHERCAPCIHPIKGVDTHVCDPIGVHEKPCERGAGDEGKAESCCHGMGVCMKEEDAPEESRDDMKRDACPEKKLCTPSAMVDNKPVKCDVLGVDGVCLDICFAAMLRGTTAVTRAGCGPTELCLPCVLGKGRGMPGCD